MQTCTPFGFLLLLILSVALLYGQFLWSPLVFDDLPFFMVDSAGNQPVSNYYFSLFELRSFPYASLAWTKSWFGLELIYFRMGNLLLHAAVVLALFFFLAKLLATTNPLPDVEGLSPRFTAFCIALIFALHPVAVYAAAYLVQRTILMATLFGLLAMLAYLHGSLQNRALWLWLSVPLYYLAVLCKEHAIMLPAALLALTILLHHDWRIKLWQRKGIFTTLAIIAVFAVAAKQGLLGSVYEVNAQEMLSAESDRGDVQAVMAVTSGEDSSYLMSILTQSWLFFKCIALWLLPNPNWLSVDMREPFAKSLSSPYLAALVSFIAWGVVGCWLLIKRGRIGLLGWAMLFPWLMFMTEFSVIRIQESFVLYRSYLWGIGVCVGLAVLLDMLRKRLLVVVVAAVLVILFPISMGRLQTFSHPLLLWDDAEKLVKDRLYLPGVNRIYYNRGNQLLKVKKLDLAIGDFKQAITLQPDWPYPYHNLGSAYLQAGQWQEAVEAFTQAIKVGQASKFGLNSKGYLGRAQAWESMNEVGKAKLDYQKSCSLIRQGCDKL